MENVGEKVEPFEEKEIENAMDQIDKKLEEVKKQ